MRNTLGIFACLVLVMLAACGQEESAPVPEPSVPGPEASLEGAVIVDHIVVGISDLEMGIEQLEALTGVRAVVGGEHPGRGTWNALISLGAGHYMELLAPVPGGVIDESDALAGNLDEFSELTPVGFAASSVDMDGLAALLLAEGYQIEGPVAGSRVKPDGSVLEWRTLSVVRPLLAGAPFFIEWGESSMHPSESSPQGCQLSFVQVGGPDAAALGSMASVLDLDIRTAAGDELALEFGLDCPNGAVLISGNGSGQ